MEFVEGNAFAHWIPDHVTTTNKWICQHVGIGLRWKPFGFPTTTSLNRTWVDTGWTWKAIQKLKLDKTVDECVLAAELLKHLPDPYLQKLLDLYNHVVCNGEVPSSWRRTVFTLLGKHVRGKFVSDFWPIASVRVWYKTFAYMILGRIEHCLENSQPKEQHGFRSGRRLEEHLITANLVGDKFFAANKPLWIASLDLSKTFDRVNWDAPWRRHGFCYQGRCATRMCALLPTYFAPYCHGLWRSEWVKPVNQWRIGPGSPFQAQAFAQLESNIARLSSGRWKSNQIKPACPWAAHLGAGDRRKPTSYVQHCTNIESHLRFTM